MPDLILLTGLDFATLVYLLIVTLLAAIVRGYSGFGFSALVVLTATWVLPPVKVVPIILLLEIIASLQLLPSIWSHIQWARLIRLLIGSAFSIPFGIYYLVNLDENLTRLTISILVLIASLLLLRGRSFARYDGPSLDLSMGLISGAITGASAVGGLAVVVVFLSVQLEVVAIRSTLVALFFATDVYASLLGMTFGLIDEKLLFTTALMIPPLVLGVVVGNRLFKKTSAVSFRKFTLLLLILLSLAGMIRFL